VRKRVLSRVMPGLAVVLGLTALVIFVLLYGRGEAGLAQEVPQVEMALTARSGEGVVGYSLLLSNQEQGEIALDRIEVLLPEGQAYVGLAASSEVNLEPSKEEKALLWSGPFILAGEGSLSLDFWAVALRDEASGLSRATIYVGGTAVASAEEEVTVAPWPAPSAVAPPSLGLGAPSPSITVTKSVTPATTFPNLPVLYTVVFTNSSGADVALNTITDTFDSSLVRHAGAAYGSQIDCPPQDQWGQSSVTCTGPYTVPAGSTLTWKYYAYVLDTFEEQTVTNTLEAEADDGSVGPETETLDIEVMKVFLPLAMKSVGVAAPASLEDHFDANADNWTPFLNYWRLKPQQWYWDAAGGYQGGGYRHNMCLGVADCDDGAHDALAMYLEGDSQEWTDYRFQAKVKLVSGTQIGVWFRGTYEEDPVYSGRKITGYFFNLTPGSDRLTLWQMQTEEECVPGTLTQYLYNFSNPIQLQTVTGQTWLVKNHWYTIKVEVEGSLIKCYVDDVLRIEYNDTIGSTFLNGTVGLTVYKADDARFDDVVVEPL